MTTENRTDVSDLLADPAAMLDEHAAARVLGLKRQTLSLWRCTGRVPLKFVRLGSKAIRYRAGDLAKFIADSTVGAAAAAE